jgi:elongation factor P hydroxylase
VTAESSGYSFKELNSAMRNLFEPDHKPNYARRFAQDFFKFLEQKLKSREGRFQEAFSEMMGPNDCTQTTRLLYEDYLSKNSHAYPMVVSNYGRKVPLE